MNKPKLRHRIIALLFTMLFVNYYCGTTMFTHVHRVNNVVVVHSHPYSHSGHSHTSAGFVTLSALSEIALLSVTALIAVAAFWALLNVIYSRTVTAVGCTHLVIKRLRAPPFLVS